MDEREENETLKTQIDKLPKLVKKLFVKDEVKLLNK